MFELRPRLHISHIYIFIHFCIVWEHWPDTREFITRSVELWNRWISVSCYYNRVQNTCPLYTHETPIFVLCIDPCNLFSSFWSIFACIQYTSWNKMSVLCCSCVQESLPLSGAGSSMKGVSKGDSLMIVCRFQVGTVSFPYFRLFKCVRVSSLDGRYLYNMYIHVHVV